MELEGIRKLMDQLAEEIIKQFPTATESTISVGHEGYRHIIVSMTQKNMDLPVEAWKRRELFEQSKFGNGEWTKDRSERQNAYYAERKLLLEV